MGHRISWAGRLRVAFACVAAAMALCLALPTSAHAATTIAKVDVGNAWKSLVVGQLVAGFVWTNPPRSSMPCAARRGIDMLHMH